MAGPRKRFDEDFLGSPVETVGKPAAPKAITYPLVTVKMAEGLVGTAQLLLANLPWTKDDVLDDLEQKLLVKDITAFAKTNPFFARSVVWLFTQMGTTSLVVDTGAIVGKRLARREVIPVQLGMACDLALIVSAAAHDIELSEDQAAMASLFGGLMGQNEPESDVPPIVNIDGTPDLVSVNLRD